MFGYLKIYLSIENIFFLTHGYLGILHWSSRLMEYLWNMNDILTGAFYVGNEWVAGGCWDYEFDS